MVLKWSKNGPKLVQKWSKSGPKMVLKWSKMVQNGPKMVQIWPKNGPKNGPKMPTIHSGLFSKYLLHLETFRAQCAQLGTLKLVENEREVS